MRKLVFSLAIATLTFAGTVYWSLHASMVGPGGSYALAGLGGPVEIRFDSHLRPYVDSENLDDALFAEGWLHVRYRLWQMELLRRAGKGRLAEGLGKSMLSTDESLWRAGVPQLGARLEESASATTLKHVDAYIAGVNAGLETYRIRPPELILTGIRPSPWTRRDVFAVGAVIAFQSANNMKNERLRLSLASVLGEEYFEVFLPDEAAQPGFPYVIFDPRLLAAGEFYDSLDALEQQLLPNASLGSSGWAVAPSKSASGRALFAFDSHDALNLPNLFYEVHLFYGSELSIRGWSLPGLPGVINGFNQHLAWGMTNIGDTQDLYLETRNPESPREFLLDGRWVEARSQRVAIPVKGWSEPHEFEILVTANGPLIEDDPAISLRWSGHDLAGRGMDALLEMNTAASWESFSAALDRHGAPTANITYADSDGHIAFRTIGLIPQRPVGKGLLPLDGSQSQNGWSGYIPDHALPAVLDPESGYVAAANARVHSGDPLISADNAPGYRMRRLHAVLAAGSELAAADMAALQLDSFNSQAARLLPHMLPEPNPWPDATDLAVEWLRDWMDRPFNSADSAAALIWEHWYPALAQQVFGTRLDEALLGKLLRENYVVNHALDRLLVDDKASIWWQGRREEILRETLADVVARLSDEYGEDMAAWRWDAAHTVSFRHELHGLSGSSDKWLSRGPYPWAGGHPVLARARYSYDRPFEGRSGATVRVVIEMAEVMGAQAVIPGGQHGHPSSQHYDDQLAAWLDGHLLPIAAEPGDVDGNITRLLPAD